MCHTQLLILKGIQTAAFLIDKNLFHVSAKKIILCQSKSQFDKFKQRQRKKKPKTRQKSRKRQSVHP